MKRIGVVFLIVIITAYGLAFADKSNIDSNKMDKKIATLDTKMVKMGIKTANGSRHKVAVLGEGAWGTACAQLLADNDCDVILWSYDAAVAESMRSTLRNDRYLPGITLNSSLKITANLGEALHDRDWVFETTPVKFLRTVLMHAKPYVTDRQTWVVLSKGIEEHTLLLPTQIIADVLGTHVKVAVCAGPSFAKELAMRCITAVTVAIPDGTDESVLPELLANNYFRPYRSTDIIGVQVSAAFKNVIALGIGMLDGAGYLENTKAFLLSRSVQEMARLVVAMGGKQETVYGLSGIGDLVLTCMGSSSRNLTVGRRLGAGHTLENILNDTGYIPEGVNTVQSIYQLMRKYEVTLPVCQGIYDVMEGKITIHEMLTSLMQQPISGEPL